MTARPAHIHFVKHQPWLECTAAEPSEKFWGVSWCRYGASHSQPYPNPGILLPLPLGVCVDLLAFDILFWTGCREGEMLALLPKDLTDDDQLRIYKTYHRKKGQDILGPTKNSKKGGNRNVPIPHWLAEEFRTYCSKLYGLTPDDRVFYMTCTALNKELTRCTQITYLPDIRVHDLRHSHVSLCIELGYSIVLVAKRIGDTVPVVMRTYAHLYPNKQQELVSRLETLSTSSSSKDESDLMPLV